MRTINFQCLMIGDVTLASCNFQRLMTHDVTVTSCNFLVFSEQ